MVSAGEAELSRFAIPSEKPSAFRDASDDPDQPNRLDEREAEGGKPKVNHERPELGLADLAEKMLQKAMLKPINIDRIVLLQCSGGC